MLAITNTMFVKMTFHQFIYGEQQRTAYDALEL